MGQLALKWLVPFVALLMWGCGCGCGGSAATGGVKPSVQQSQDQLVDLAKQVDGNYDKLLPADKQKVLNAYGGDEQTARTRFRFIMHPPGSGSKTAPAGAGG